MKKLKKDDPHLNRAIEMAMEIKRQLEGPPIGIEHPGFKRRAKRASEYIANQPEAQAIIAKHLNIPL
ncbi:hypothetical protein [Neobacillus cucumis]|uniref:hypothetical protein n=1 Tax=Neobacillus cucumis TaxID=1740721 RepID=UPI0019638646|nr:hypothetical protein [Neobacillus cucumis]MBM7656210.1 hypothetical protein [Neobacillus cucumis]